MVSGEFRRNNREVSTADVCWVLCEITTCIVAR
uniref:Uncharacterized protein n=1 Tax=Anguilla anguilla TaxID=7936 RepID=A0A0E9UWX9_ANGAN